MGFIAMTTYPERKMCLSSFCAWLFMAAE